MGQVLFAVVVAASLVGFDVSELADIVAHFERRDGEMGRRSAANSAHVRFFVGHSSPNPEAIARLTHAFYHAARPRQPPLGNYDEETLQEAKAKPALGRNS